MKSKTNGHVGGAMLMTKRKFVLAASAMAGVMGLTRISSGATIADWTFDVTAPATAGPISPEVGAGSASGSHAGAATYSSPAGNGTAHSYSANTWAVNDYWQFTASTVGLSSINVSWDQTGSSTGPAKFALETSTTGAAGSFTIIQSYTVALSNWSAGTHNTGFSFTQAITGLDNLSTAYFRLVDVATTSIGNGTTAAAGTDRVDNFLITGSVPNQPTGLLTYDPGATAGGTPSTLFTTDTSVQNFIDGGTGADVAFANGNTVTFSQSAGGTVSVADGVTPAATNVTNTSGTYTFTDSGTTGIGGTGALNMSGVGGTLVLNGVNSYSGGTNITGGEVQTIDGGLGTGGIILNGATAKLTALANINDTSSTATITVGANGGTFNTNGFASTFGGSLTGASSGLLAVTGGGSLTLTGMANTSPFGLNIASSTTVSLQTSGALPPFVELTNGTINGTLLVGQNVAGATAGNPLQLEFDSAATLSGTGTIGLVSGDKLAAFGSSTAFTGTINPTIVLNGGSYLFTATQNTALALSTINEATGPANVSIGAVPTSVSSGKLATSALIGKITFNGAANYTGTTTILGGTLVVNSTLASSSVTVNAPVSPAGITSGPTTYTPTLAGTGTISGTVALSGQITAGSGATSSDSTGTLHTGTETWNTGSTYAAKINITSGTAQTAADAAAGTSSGASDLLVLSGLDSSSTGLNVLITPTGTNGLDPSQTYSYLIAQITDTSTGDTFESLGANLTVTAPFGAQLSTFQFGNTEDLVVSITAVPEPTSMALIGLVSTGLLARRRRKAVMA